ncbi:hypothetical protein ACHHYP_04107 [Achlya hypogyna]|uniref:Guanylate cyclase domain-containing protein n=1 Tax=Achlya hypogyna TaxID=1202772 RepID=A0A1V9Z252_ACHHY|nr:hypothetical protein ACHHYP_04107 [Achlya hypogyna]
MSCPRATTLQRRAQQRHSSKDACLFSFSPSIPAAVPVQLLNHYAHSGASPTRARAVATSLPGAALMMADISHCTAPVDSKLVAALSADGQRGIQTLCELMEACFSAMVDLIYAHGGDVVKFAGDALVVSFSNERGTAVEQCAACALQLVEHSSAFTYGTEAVHLHIAITTGDLVGLHLGGENMAFEYLLAGEPFAQLSVVLAKSAPDTVALSSRAWACLGDAADGHVLSSGEAFALTRLRWQPAPVSLASPPLTKALVHAVRKYAPAPFVATVDEQRFDLVAEYRQTTVLFVTLDNVSLASATIDVDRIQRVFLSMQHILQCHGGYCRQFLADDKGTVLIVAFGVHGFAHYDNALRAVKTALEITDALSALAVTASCGIATGMAYIGLLGCARRHEYAVLGNAVITAARLSGISSPATVLCDAATMNLVDHERDLRCELHGHLPLKGRDEKETVFAVTATSGRTRHPMVGRQAQSARVHRQLECHSSTLVIVEGAIGSGRSCFLDHMEALVQSDIGRPTVRFQASWHDAPLALWRTVLPLLFERSRLAAEYASPNHLAAALAGHDDAAGVALHDVLAAIGTASDGPADRGATFALLRLVVAACVADTRPVLFVDDFEAVDEASLSFLATLLDAEAPLQVLVSVPATTSCQALRSRLRLHYKRVYQWRVAKLTVRLAPLSPAQIAGLSSHLLGAAAVAPDVSAFIAATSFGSPLWIQQIVHYLLAKGFVHVAAGCATFTPSFAPSAKAPTIHEIILAQVEELSETQRWLLKLGALIGPCFQAKELLWLCHGLAHLQPWVDSDQLQWHLTLLCKAGYLEIEGDRPTTTVGRRRSHSDTLTAPPLPTQLRRGHSHHDIASTVQKSLLNQTFRFRHRKTQEALVEVFLPAQRRLAHALMVDLLEDLSLCGQHPHLVRLAHHCAEAGAVAKTVKYLERAGALALAAGDAHDALGIFQRLLHELGGPPASQVAWHLNAVCARRLALSDAAADALDMHAALALLETAPVTPTVVAACLATASAVALESRFTSTVLTTADAVRCAGRFVQLPGPLPTNFDAVVSCTLAAACGQSTAASADVLTRASAELRALAFCRVGRLVNAGELAEYTAALSTALATGTPHTTAVQADLVYLGLGFGIAEVPVDVAALCSALTASAEPRLGLCLGLAAGNDQFLAPCTALAREKPGAAIGGLPPALVVCGALVKRHHRHKAWVDGLAAATQAAQALQSVIDCAGDVPPTTTLHVYLQWLAMFYLDAAAEAPAAALRVQVRALQQLGQRLYAPTGLSGVARAFVVGVTNVVLASLGYDLPRPPAMAVIAASAHKAHWHELRRQAVYVAAHETSPEKVSWTQEAESPEDVSDKSRRPRRRVLPLRAHNNHLLVDY